jgi:hypothetical protein
VLQLMAGPIHTIPQPDIDWEIKSATPPYEGLQELASELNLGSIAAVVSTVEIVAFHVAAIDLQYSKVSGSKADLGVVVAGALDPGKVKLGYESIVPDCRPSGR